MRRSVSSRSGPVATCCRHISPGHVKINYPNFLFRQNKSVSIRMYLDTYSTLGDDMFGLNDCERQYSPIQYTQFCEQSLREATMKEGFLRGPSRRAVLA